MTAFYDRIRLTADRLLVQYGTPALILKPGEGTRDEWGYVPGADTEHECTVVLTAFNFKEQTDSAIEYGDMKALVSATGEEPTVEDKLSINGDEWRIISVMQVSPAGEAVLYKCQVRL